MENIITAICSGKGLLPTEKKNREIVSLSSIVLCHYVASSAPEFLVCNEVQTGV